MSKVSPEAEQEHARMQTVIRENLIRIRKKAGLSQKQLADLVGLNVCYVGYMENNHRDISTLMVARFAVALRVPSEKFYLP